MVREVISVLWGRMVWQVLRLRFCINERTVVLVLTGDNLKLDQYALVHLKDFMNRKYAKEAVILFYSQTAYRQIKSADLPDSVRLCRWPEEKIKKLYDYYSFYLFSDKIVFTYTDSPKDNQLGRLLKETLVQEEEAVCLGLYRLRRVPDTEKDNRKV